MTVTTPRPAVVRSKLLTAAHLFPGLIIDFNEERFVTPRGFADLIFLYDHVGGVGKPPFDQAFHLDTRHGHFTIQVAILGELQGKPDCWSWVNGAPTPNHGDHVLGLRDALRRVGWSARTAMIHVVMHQPKFAGPTKDRLVNREVRRAVRECLTEPLRRFLGAG